MVQATATAKSAQPAARLRRVGAERQTPPTTAQHKRQAIQPGIRTPRSVGRARMAGASQSQSDDRDQDPIKPCLPRSSTKIRPATTGETEKGRSIRETRR